MIAQGQSGKHVIGHVGSGNMRIDEITACCDDCLTEGYKIQLERDGDLYVLHITDNQTGKRTEVRGQSGYESGNYNPDDKLHQLLDKIGKSANISELINGEVVTINPKHPDATKAQKAADVAFNEAAGLMFKGYPCTKDCSGHKAGWHYAKQRNMNANNKADVEKTMSGIGGPHNSFHEGMKSYLEGR